MSKSEFENPHLRLVRQELKKCTKCGECCSVCPVFLEKGEEKYVARGKLALIEAVLNKKLPMSDEFYDVVNNCLLCLSCVDNCAGNVRVDKVISAARSDLIDQRGLPLAKQIAFKLLRGRNSIVPSIFRGGSLIQRGLFKKIPKTSGLRRRFPMPLIDKEQYIPQLACHPFRCNAKDYYPAESHGDTVLFFTGCTTNYIYTDIAHRVVHALNTLGINVIVPKTQVCCGAPADANGDIATSLELARKNLTALCGQGENLDVVVPCSSGGYMLKKKYPEFFKDDTRWLGPAENIAGRTYDISQYLVEKIGLNKIASHLKRQWPDRLTYHDPCHLRKGQRIIEAPRQLLRLAAGKQYVEMEDAQTCCGLGGTYGLSNRQTSLDILSQKTGRVMDVRAKSVVTGCPGCMIQLNDGLQRKKSQTSVMHTIEILSYCLMAS